MTKSGLVPAAALVVAIATAACRDDVSTQDPSSTGATESALRDPVKHGEQEFNRPLPTGNGRACATCHIPNEAFTLTPATVEARFAALPRDVDGNVVISNACSQDADAVTDDALFRGADADTYRPCGQPLAPGEQFTNLRRGLARVFIDLPANIYVKELGPAVRAVPLWRAVPTVWNVAFTGPVGNTRENSGPPPVVARDTGGFLFDGRAATLQLQANGAAFTHSEVTRISEQTLDDIAAFQQTQFSSAQVRDATPRLLAGSDGPRVESSAPLTADQEAGKARFQFRCQGCHFGNRTMDRNWPARDRSVFVSERNLPGLPVLTWVITKPDNTTVELTSPDPGRLLVTGNAAHFNHFEKTTLYGISKTAPYFHDNSAPDLDAVMVHYELDFADQRAKLTAAGRPIPPPIATPMTAEEMRIIIEYLKVL